MKSGCVVIGKIPDVVPEWMLDEENNISPNGLWFYDIRDAQKIIANVIKCYMDDSIPESYLEMAKSFENKYTMESKKEQIETLFSKYIENRIAEIEDVKNKIISQNK